MFTIKVNKTAIKYLFNVPGFAKLETFFTLDFIRNYFTKNKVDSPSGLSNA